MILDLHTHSTISDGSMTPQNVVSEAVKCGVKLLALCDHDTVGDSRFLDEAGKFGLNAVQGIEISADFSKGTCHILGLGVDDNCSQLQNALDKVVESRSMRNEKIIDKLNKSGVNITLDEVKVFAGDADVLGRPHMAKLMVDKKIVGSIQDAFDIYLKKGAVAYVDRLKMDPVKSIELLVASGAKPVIAHPTQLNRNFDELDTLFSEWKECGLWGIEVYTPYTDDSILKNYMYLAKKYELKITGGSDFHGTNKKGHFLGELRNGKKIDTSLSGIVSVEDVLG